MKNKSEECIRLEQIYQSSYGKKRSLKLKTVKKFGHKIDIMEHDIRAAQKATAVAAIHVVLAKYIVYARKSGRKQALGRLRNCVTLLAQKDYSFIENFQDRAHFIDYLEQNPEEIIKGSSIVQRYEEFETNLFKKEMMDRVQSDPIVEFAEARLMTRHFLLHIGPTNSGKTHDAIERLKSAECGIYLSPLRLLALEIHDVMTDAGISCEMITGEEHIQAVNPTVISQTIETADLDQDYDVAVIDEAQMLQDEYRGHAWVRALMGVKSPEIHVCASPDAQKILTDIIGKCGDTYEVIYHERKTPLRMDEDIVRIKGNSGVHGIEPGDAFILFSKRAVLDMAARLEIEGIKASVIYGHLPPEIRKNEVRKFMQHETEVVVSTDAIGMGINLPIRRIVFVQTQKYDGKSRRLLTESEVKQIAGRAGRYGLYEKGLVTATSADACAFIEERLSAESEPIRNARLSFPKVLLEIEKPLDEIMNMWVSIPAVFPYKKMAVTEMITLYGSLKNASENFLRLPCGEDKALIYQMISCPLDIKNDCVVFLWEQYCLNYGADVSMEFPDICDAAGKNDLERWENYYKLLDLYHNFSLRMGKVIETERLQKAKEDAEVHIIGILSRSKKGYIKRCSVCGKVLPLDYMYNRCSDCRW